MVSRRDQGGILLLRIFHSPSFAVMAGGAVVNARTMFTVAVGAVFRLAEVIAVMRIDSGEVLFDFAGLRILHA